MRIVTLYRPNSEHARRVEEYIHEFNKLHPGATIEVMNIDSTEGGELARLYGVVEYPSMLVLKDDGQLQQQWTGENNMPLMNDLAYYGNQ